MEPLEPDEEATVVRRVRPVEPDPDTDDPEADTVIRERLPFADLPADAVVEFAREELIEPALRPQPVPAPGPAMAQTAPIDPVGVDAQLRYFFSINYHEPIGLDVPALVGRKPSLPRIPLGDRPRLVRVPSPLGEVSGTHLELRQQGSSIVVTDLRSTNGTVVIAPGRPPLTLLQGESVVVVPGTVVDIGDGNIVEILPGRTGGTGATPPERHES